MGTTNWCGCTQAFRLPDLAQTGRIYRELLAAFFIADLPPETLERAATAVKDLPAEDQSLAAAQLRGLTISHADWIRKSRIRSGLRRAGWRCSRKLMSCC